MAAPDSPKQKTPNPLEPSVSLLCKLGSIARHLEEATTPGRYHPFDELAMKDLIEDADVEAWMTAMDAKALLPVKRDA